MSFHHLRYNGPSFKYYTTKEIEQTQALNAQPDNNELLKKTLRQEPLLQNKHYVSTIGGRSNQTYTFYLLQNVDDGNQQ